MLFTRMHASCNRLITEGALRTSGARSSPILVQVRLASSRLQKNKRVKCEYEQSHKHNLTRIGLDGTWLNSSRVNSGSNDRKRALGLRLCHDKCSDLCSQEVVIQFR